MKGYITRQVSDTLIYEGKEYPFLSLICLPENDARIVELTVEEYVALFDDGNEERKGNLKKVNDEIAAKINAVEALTGEVSYTLTDDENERLEKYTYRPSAYSTLSPSCVRHYFATWKVEKGVFYLSDIVGRYKLDSDEPIIVDWYTGTLKFGFGEILYSNRIMASHDIFEKENHIRIKDGIVTSEDVIENDKDADSLYAKIINGNPERLKILKGLLNDSYL